jgi:hypothetical protein
MGYIGFGLGLGEAGLSAVLGREIHQSRGHFTFSGSPVFLYLSRREYDRPSFQWADWGTNWEGEEGQSKWQDSAIFCPGFLRDIAS